MDLNDTDSATVSVGPFSLDTLMAQSAGLFITGNHLLVVRPDASNPSLWWVYGYGNLKPTALEDFKKQKCETIDNRSQILIGKGFTYNNQTFSLSLDAQVKWLGLLVGSSQIQFPYTVPTNDNTETFAIPDVATIQTMYGTAMGTVSSILSSGTTLKALVNAASDIDAVNNIIDSR